MSVQEKDAPGDASLSCHAKSSTSCRAHTRVYRDGVVVAEGFPVEDVSEHLADPGNVVWLDLEDPDRDDLAVLTEELGLHHLAVEDAVNDRQRPKIDRYSDHLFLNTYVVRLDAGSGELTTGEIAAFVMPQALVTIRKDPTISVEPLIAAWDGARQQSHSSVAFLLHGLLDVVVDGHFAVVQDLDEAIEALEDVLFDPNPRSVELQRRSFELRKSLVQLRRVVLPMREVVNTLLRRDVEIVDEAMQPYFQDVYDHVLRASEWTESLRDLVSTIMETNLMVQGNRLNEVMRRLTAYAALLGITTAITGFFGQNVPYPGFAQRSGLIASVILLGGSLLAAWAAFRKRGWL